MSNQKEGMPCISFPAVHLPSSDLNQPWEWLVTIMGVPPSWTWDEVLFLAVHVQWNIDLKGFFLGEKPWKMC